MEFQSLRGFEEEEAIRVAYVEAILSFNYSGVIFVRGSAKEFAVMR